MFFLSHIHRRALKKQIAEMESTLIQPRSWELQGETTASSRKENELLEVDLDVDRVGVSAPVSTVESTLSLEELIKVLLPSLLLSYRNESSIRRSTIQFAKQRLARRQPSLSLKCPPRKARKASLRSTRTSS